MSKPEAEPNLQQLRARSVQAALLNGALGAFAHAGCTHEREECIGKRCAADARPTRRSRRASARATSRLVCTGRVQTSGADLSTGAARM